MEGDAKRAESKARRINLGLPCPALALALSPLNREEINMRKHRIKTKREAAARGRMLLMTEEADKLAGGVLRGNSGYGVGFAPENPGVEEVNIAAWRRRARCRRYARGRPSSLQLIKSAS